MSTYPLFEYPPYALALASKMIDVVKHEKLDLLHVHYAIPHATSAVLARQILDASGQGVPVVTTLHGTDITLIGKDPSFKPVVEHAIDASDGVTAVSDWLRRETYESFDVTNEIEVIPNFIDTARFQRQPKDHFRRAIAPDGETAPRPHLQLPPRQARHGRGAGVRAAPRLWRLARGPPAPRAARRREAAHGRRRPRPRRLRGPRPRDGRVERRALHRQAGARRGDPLHRRRVPDAFGLRDVRAGRAGGDGLRRPRRLVRHRRPARAQRRRRDGLPAASRRTSRA